MNYLAATPLEVGMSEEQVCSCGISQFCAVCVRVCVCCVRKEERVPTLLTSRRAPVRVQAFWTLKGLVSGIPAFKSDDVASSLEVLFITKI